MPACRIGLLSNMLEDLHQLACEFRWFFAAGVFLFGACWGSFLNVCIYRIPKGESVVTPRSHCGCGKLIAWYDNIPILSWFLLGGKARCCGARFSFRYAMVEALTGALFAALFLLVPPAQAWPGMLFFAILIAAAFIDLDHMILPNVFTVGGMIVGVLVSFAVPALHGFGHSGDPWIVDALRSGLSAMIGAIVGAGVILWIMELAEVVLRKEAMGYGDVVFMGCIGAFCGWEGAIFSIFGGAFVGALVIIPIVVARQLGAAMGIGGKTASKAEHVAGEDGQPDAEEGEGLGFGVAVPFGPWLALGAMIYYLAARHIVDAYFSQLRVIIYPSLWGN